jgi:nitronate monooxygenase
MENYTDMILDYPVQHTLTKNLRATAVKQGNTDYMSMWAGQAHHLARELPAATLIENLNRDIKNILHQLK